MHRAPEGVGTIMSLQKSYSWMCVKESVIGKMSK